MYSAATFYNFPDKQPFSGTKFYNPYAGLIGGELRIKANFHAHAKAWGNLTYGANTDGQVYTEYSKRGYTISGVSNYHRLSEFGQDTAQVFIPIYEHGYNVLKSHYLAIDPKKISYFDYPLMQSTSMQQDIIEAIQKNGGLVVLAHPELGARSMNDMDLLCHYEFTEVLNHFRISDEYWDKALSSGRLSWIMANDDTHNVFDETPFKMWNEIYVDSLTKTSVLNHIKKGMHYGIHSRTQGCDTHLETCELISDTLHIRFEEEINRYEVSCQNGKIIAMVNQTQEIAIPMLEEYQYVRVVAHNDESIAYLNPIVRYSNELPYKVKLELTTNHFKTWMFRLSMYLLIVLQGYFIYRIFRKKKSVI